MVWNATGVANGWNRLIFLTPVSFFICLGPPLDGVLTYPNRPQQILSHFSSPSTGPLITIIPTIIFHQVPSILESIHCQFTANSLPIRANWIEINALWVARFPGNDGHRRPPFSAIFGHFQPFSFGSCCWCFPWIFGYYLFIVIVFLCVCVCVIQDDFLAQKKKSRCVIYLFFVASLHLIFLIYFLILFLLPQADSFWSN